MSVRLLLTDEAWAEIAPILATLQSRAGRPPTLRDRLFIEAVLCLIRTGLPWRDLPEDSGHWDAVYKRLRRVEAAGDGGTAAIPLGQVTPGSPGADDPQNAVQDASVVSDWAASVRFLRRKQGL